MIYTIYCDTHIGSPIEILKAKLTSEPPHPETLLLGDIVDLANTSHKELPHYVEVYNKLKKIHGANYIPGNHERVTSKNEVIIKGRVLFAHGDMEANPKKWREYRLKPQGAGFLKRKLLVPFIREAEELIERSPKQDFLERASYIAKIHNCDKYVCGHFHVKEVLHVVHNNIHIYLLPRGLTVIDL